MLKDVEPYIFPTRTRVTSPASSNKHGESSFYYHYGLTTINKRKNFE